MRGLWPAPAGDEADDELTWLIAREAPRLRRYAGSLLNDAAAADDLVQDCVERALRKRHLWQRRGSIRGWLLRMLYNLYLNTAKRRRRDASLDDLRDSGALPAEPARQTMRIELREMLEALAKLPSEQRETILLVVLEGLSYDEAAWILGVPVGTVRSRLARGRKSLYELRRERAPRAQLQRVK